MLSYANEVSHHIFNILRKDGYIYISKLTSSLTYSSVCRNKHRHKSIALGKQLSRRDVEVPGAREGLGS